MTALSQNILQENGSQILNVMDTYSTTVPAPQGNTKRSTSLYRKTKRSQKDKSRRFSTPVQTSSQDADYEGIDCSALASSTGPQRKANDSLPSLPLAMHKSAVYKDPIPVYEAVVSEATEQEDEHYECPDSIYEEKFEDEEGYVSVSPPTERVTVPSERTGATVADIPANPGTQESPDENTTLSLDYQNVQTIYPRLSTDESTSKPVPSIVLYQSVKAENSEEIRDEIVDPVEFSGLQVESVGNLSSLEASSPCPLHAMATIESYLQSLHLNPDLQVNQKLPSPLSSESKLERCYNDFLQENNTCTTEEHQAVSNENMNTANSVLDDTSPTSRHIQPHAYDILRHEYWRQSGNTFSTCTSRSPPARLDLALTKEPEQQSHGQQFQQFHDNPSASASVSVQGDHIQMQMLMLQKMQQALEAMQVAYAHLPNMTHSAETTSNTGHGNEETSLDQTNIVQDRVSPPKTLWNNVVPQLLDPRETMSRCLSKSNAKYYMHHVIVYE